MKTNLLTLATILTIGFFTNNITAQGTKAELTDASASAHLVKVMSLEQGDELDFGTILLVGTEAGTFTLNADGTTTAATGTHLIATGGHAAKVGTYTVGGTKNSTYAVSIPEAKIIVANGDGGTTVNEMTIDDLNLDFTSNVEAGGVIGKLAADGTDSFKLGGTLNIIAEQNAGVYAGTFTISVDYN
jgi:hypothetical protein